MRTDHGGGTDAKNTGWGRDRAKTTQICLKHKVLKKLFIEISKAIKIFIFLSEILKKERHSPLLEELTNAPPPVRGFLTNANHREWQDDQCTTNARGVDGRTWN